MSWRPRRRLRCSTSPALKSLARIEQLGKAIGKDVVRQIPEVPELLAEAKRSNDDNQEC
jgi:hypothetical protein